MKEMPLSSRREMPLTSQNTEFDEMKLDVPEEGSNEIKFMTPIELTEELSPVGWDHK